MDEVGKRMRLERLYSHPHQALRASFSHRVKPFTRRKTQFMTVRSIHARLRAIHDRKVNSPFNPPVDFIDRLRLGLTTFGLRLQTAHCAVCLTPTHPLHKGAFHARLRAILVASAIIHYMQKAVCNIVCKRLFLTVYFL